MRQIVERERKVMENKVLKKILVMAIVFVLTFSNCGLTLQALASSEGMSFFGFKLFAKNHIDYKAYFLDENGKEVDEATADVNGDMTLVLEFEPKENGYLKAGTIKAITETGEPNFEFKEILNLSTKNDEKEKEGEQKEEEPSSSLQSVPVEETLLQTSQSLDTTEVPTAEIGDTATENNTVAENNTTVQNTVQEQNTTQPENVVDTNTATENENTVTEAPASENTVTQEPVPENTVTEPTVDNSSIDNTIVEDQTAMPTEQIPVISLDDDALVDEENVYQEEIKDKEDDDAQISSSSAKITSSNEITFENIITDTKIYVKLGYHKGETLNVSDLYKEAFLKLEGTYINEDLEQITVTSEDSITTEWTYSKDILVSSEIVKVSPFEVEGTKGTIVESKITLNRNCEENNYLPLKQTTIEVQPPQINGKSPIALEVSANKLMATRGEEISSATFTSDNWIYNEENNTIIIKVENLDTVLTTGEDIYTIVYRYDEYVESEEISLALKGTLTAEEYSGKGTNRIVKDFSDDKKAIVNIGELITYSIGTSEDFLSKAKINANYNSVEAVYEEEFKSTVAVNILTNDVLREFTIKDTKEYYIDKANLEFEAQDITYKAIGFKYSEIGEMLQLGGIIEIRANTGEVLMTLDSNNTTSDANCYIVLNPGIHGVEVSLKNIKVNGVITVDFVKSLGKCAYDKSAFNNFEKLQSRIKAEAKYGTSEEVFELPLIQTEKLFEKSYTRAEISMNKDELTTILDNDNVEMKIELNNNKSNSDLYINPEFEVVFPSYVQNVEVKSVNLLYEDGLVLKNVNIFRDEQNKERMKIQLEGVQRTLSTSDVTNGTNIIINTKITVDDYTPRKDDQIKMYYFNQGVSNYQSQTDWKISTPTPDGLIRQTNGFDVAVITFKAPEGFVTTNAIENYDGLGSTVESIKQGEITARIEMGEIPRQSIMNLTAMNNTGNKCTDVMMLGRIPHTETTDVITNEKSKSNRNTQMLTGITQADANPIGCDIYYSTNGKATKDLYDSINHWTKTPEDMSQVKSYLIVPTSAVEPGTLFKFSYNFQIPANLPYEVELYGSFGAFYNNHSDVAVMYESTKSDLVGLVTEVGPRLEASMAVNIGDGKDVGEARYIQYTVEVANTGSVLAEEVVATINLPDELTICQYTNENGYGNDNFVETDVRSINWRIGNMDAGQREKYTFVAKTGVIPTIENYYSKILGVTLEKDEKGYYYTKKPAEGSEDPATEEPEKVYVDTNYTVNIENQAIITATNFGNYVATNKVKNKLVDSDFDMVVNTECNTDIKLGQNFAYMNSFKNISGQDLKNVEINIALPNTVEYVDTEMHAYERTNIYEITKINYDTETHTVKIKIDDIKKDEAMCMYVNVEGKSGSDQTIDTYFTMQAEGRALEKSYELTRKYAAADLKVNQTTDILNNVKEDEQVQLNIEIENAGNYMAQNVQIEDLISENLNDVVVNLSGVTSAKYKPKSGEEFRYTIANFPAKEKLLVQIIGKAVRLNGTAKTISNKLDVSATDIDTISSNVININIEENPNKKDEKIYNNPNETANNPNRPSNDNIKTENPSNNNNANTNNNANNSTNNNSNNNANNNNNASNNNQNNNVNNNTNKKPEEKHSITGIVWLDSNKNSRRDDDEKGMSAVEVELYQGRKVVNTTTTNGSGVYQFTNIPAGDYTVNFKYDGEKYISSTYKGADIEEDRNSDAMSYADGIAVTNTITIADLNLENVNCGLQERDTFDLTVGKFITKSVVNAKGKETAKTYDNADLTKIDLDAKKMKNSTVTLTYKIVLTNIGNVPGRALKLVDHLPNDMEFVDGAKENKDWYLGSDGKLYNESLKEENIAPGETKELTLVLVRKMNTENTGVISNLIEIAEAESSLNVSEQKDNNTATQETILSIKTGGHFVPITIIFIIMALGGYAIITERLIIKVENSKLKVKFNTKKIYK